MAVVVPEPQNDQGEFFDWEVQPRESETIVKNNPVKVIEQPSTTVLNSPVKTIEQPATTAITKREEVNINNNQSGMHRVVPGETLYAIAKLYQVEVTQLLTWNNLDITQPLKPGQQLVISDTSPVVNQADPISAANKSDEWVTHEVKTSDTLYSVARQYNVTIKEIMDWNGKSDFTLAQGEKLKILSK